ncbi:MAG: bifunctional enoyl-CoA hydratase/phosphate acetyltransferase [Tindallia sp. MSAO_Bac2]|nr:MAG: bifunctional enoyl-CoA hydratase/phosphate acetyltransferase [Tindallia sp. MSAO_Bac2]
MIKSLAELSQKVSGLPPNTIAVAQAADEEVLEVAQLALKKCLAKFVFLGDKKKIEEMIEKGNYKLDDVEIVDATTDKECSQKAVELVRNGKADIPMKGLLPTAEFMKAVLDREHGLRTEQLVTQVTVTDSNDGEKLHFITDCAMNITPDLKNKKQIIENAVSLARSLGCDCPRVALVTALETVNEAMPETLDAAILSKMNERGQIKNCIVDGPFALDNAISEESALHKGIRGKVAGKADVLVVSDIRMGNVLHKSLTYYANKRVGSVIMGTSHPLVMTSRSDSIEDKLVSIAISSLMVSNRHG